MNRCECDRSPLQPASAASSAPQVLLSWGSQRSRVGTRRCLGLGAVLRRRPRQMARLRPWPRRSWCPARCRRCPRAQGPWRSRLKVSILMVFSPSWGLGDQESPVPAQLWLMVPLLHVLVSGATLAAVPGAACSRALLCVFVHSRHAAWDVMSAAHGGRHRSQVWCSCTLLEAAHAAAHALGRKPYKP